MQDPGVGDILM